MLGLQGVTKNQTSVRIRNSGALPKKVRGATVLILVCFGQAHRTNCVESPIALFLVEIFLRLNLNPLAESRTEMGRGDGTRNWIRKLAPMWIALFCWSLCTVFCSFGNSIRPLLLREYIWNLICRVADHGTSNQTTFSQTFIAPSSLKPKLLFEVVPTRKSSTPHTLTFRWLQLSQPPTLHCLNSLGVG